MWEVTRNGGVSKYRFYAIAVNLDRDRPLKE
jgi:hypothetical protein